MTMNKSLAYALTLSLVTASSAWAQSTEVQVGPNGVKVKTDGADVQVGDDGVNVKTGRTQTTVKGKVSVKTGGGSAVASSAQSQPFVCKGNQELRLKDTVLTVKGDAVIAEGNCELVIINCQITATKNAVRASGNADVKLINSKVRGKKAALHLSGNANVTAKKSRVKGRVIKTGNADFEKED